MQRKKSTLYKEAEPNGAIVVDDSGVPGAVKLKEPPKRVKHRWTSDQDNPGLDERFAVSTRFHVSVSCLRCLAALLIGMKCWVRLMT